MARACAAQSARYLGPACTSCPIVAVLYTLRELRRPNSYVVIGAIGVVGVAIYGLLYLALSRGLPEQALVSRLTGEAVSAIRRMARRAAEEARVAK